MPRRTDTYSECKSDLTILWSRQHIDLAAVITVFNRSRSAFAVQDAKLLRLQYNLQHVQKKVAQSRTSEILIGVIYQSLDFFQALPDLISRLVDPINHDMLALTRISRLAIVAVLH